MSFLYKPSIWSKLLTPLSWLLGLLIALRKKLYQVGIFGISKSTLPVIVVGNITVGGTGKSPLVAYLVKELVQRGLKPGIVSRGYGGKSNNYPLLIQAGTSASEAGDEAKMLAESCQVPVVVDPDRSQAVRFLAEHSDCDVVLSDDGLQHYAMARHVEIVVIDKSRALGNRLLLPLGPLREPASRLNSVSAVVHNYRFNQPLPKLEKSSVPAFQASFTANGFVSVSDANIRLSVSELRERLEQSKQPAYAVAGIGNPQSFFDYLCAQNIECDTQPFADHHDFTAQDFSAAQDFILMSEKDAIKCRHLQLNNAWFLAIEMRVSPNLADFCLEQIAREER